MTQATASPPAGAVADRRSRHGRRLRGGSALVAAVLAFAPAAGSESEPSARDEPSRSPQTEPSPSDGAQTLDVPLSLWTDPRWPAGLPLGVTIGVSWGDYDADGFVDLFCSQSGLLWRNLRGETWELAADLTTVMRPAERRYGASFADYDRDGLPDIAVAPRRPLWGDDRLHLLRNLGGGRFVEVASDPSIVDVQPHHNAETLCWADVDADGHLDLFVPVYPWWAGGPGNFFLWGRGPTGPAGAHRFTEASGAAGLDNPPGSSRPEGAQAADVDLDGDVDLFSNGTLYRNVSSRGSPRFEAMPTASSGIGLASSLEEGAMFFDYDLDGDFDLATAYVADGVRIWENLGDGTFFAVEPEVVENPMSGHTLGMSAEDWDNDGDIDFTTRHVFRRNLLVEERRRRFRVAAHAIPPEHLVSAMPAWGDWDRDGDLDCALGNWGLEGRLYQNTLYGPATPAAAKRYVRIKPVAESVAVPRGLEVEFGAVAEVRLTNPEDEFRRRKFVASSHGYLNQNEYALHFGLASPALESVEDPRFDVSVDFPSLPKEGHWRVDKHVNPALGDIELRALGDREIRVSRCGYATIDGVLRPPLPLAPLRLRATSKLVEPALEASLPPIIDAPRRDWNVGLALHTRAASRPVRIEEIVIDGHLDDPVRCGASAFNLAVWDVTEPGRPTPVPGGLIARRTSARNHRSHLPVEIVLQPGRSYRIAARVRAYRETAIEALPDVEEAVSVFGGLAFGDPAPCAGSDVARAGARPLRAALALRYREVPADPRPDPVDASLRLDPPRGGDATLRWRDAGAGGYRILRCDASAGVCDPAPHASTPTSSFTDPGAATGPALLWYRIEALNDCAASL